MANDSPKISGTSNILGAILDLISRPTANPPEFQLAQRVAQNRLSPGEANLKNISLDIPGINPNDALFSLISAQGRGQKLPFSPLQFGILDFLRPDINRRISERRDLPSMIARAR